MSEPHSAGNRPAFSIHLDAIRGLAALVVFAGHARDLFIDSPREALLGIAQAAENAGPAARHATVGRHAVIIFFVLSGYLVGGGVLRAKLAGSWSWRIYLTNRLTRLWLPLLPALLIGCLLDRFGLSCCGDNGSIYDGPPGQLVVDPGLADRTTWPVLLGNALFLQGIAVPVFGTNSALWSLSYEFWYYITFPLLYYLLVQRGVSSTGRLGALGALAAIGLLVGPTISLYFVIWLMGVALAAVPRMPWPSAGSMVVLPAALLFIAATGLLLKYPLDVQQSDFIAGSAFSLLLYAMLHLRNNLRHELYARAAERLSDMSYTLYLSHMPVLVLLCAAMNRPWHHSPLDLPHAAVLAAVLAAAFIYCCVIWYCFERHTGRARRRILGVMARRGDCSTPVPSP